MHVEIIYNISLFLTLTFILCNVDKCLCHRRWDGNYYLLHSLGNFIITYLCFDDLLISYNDLFNFNKYKTDITPSIITFSMHTYHIINYKDKLLFDDWVHHILMCGVALPLSLYVKSGCLLNHGLFFLTGLPGAINYLNLFLVRNSYISRSIQKRINLYLNLWLRAPGCISHFVLCILVMDSFDVFEKLFIRLTITLIFWNGIYFMNQVVQNYAIERYLNNIS